jgi:transposase
VLAYLPAYAPELNPVEGLWANLKGCELANRCCADRTELIATVQVGSIRVRRDPILLRSFLAGTSLTYNTTFRNHDRKGHLGGAPS